MTSLSDHPFNKHGTIIDLFDRKLNVVQKIVGKIDQLNARWDVERTA